MNLLPNTKYKNNERTVSGNVPVENSDVLINVDTSLVPCTIYLKEIPKDYWSTLYILYIKDLSGNCATNNITIEAPIGYKINNQQSIILNVNSVCVTIKIASNTDYNTSYNTQTITGGHIIADEGTPLPQQPILNFVGDLVTASNGTGETVVTINNNLAVQNTVYVMKNGSDTTGLVERFDKPFLTIAAAVDAIRIVYPDIVRNPNFRVKVVVEDGTYIESNIIYFYPYIDFDFGNSVIKAHFTDNFVTSVTYSSNPNNDFTTKIFGNAKLSNNVFLSGIPQLLMIYLVNVNQKTLIQCDELYCDKDDTIAIFLGYCKVICNSIIQDSKNYGLPQFAHCIEMSQKGTSTSATDKCTLDIWNATLYTYNVNGSTISFGDNNGNGVNTLNQDLNLYNCVVLNNLQYSGTQTDKNVKNSAITAGATNNLQVGSRLNLYNTTLYSKYGRTIYVCGTTIKANLEVNYYNTNCGNTVPLQEIIGANYSLNQNISNLLVSPQVLPTINF